MSCTFWIRRKKAAAKLLEEKQVKAVEKAEKPKPVKKAGAKNDGGTSKKS